MATITFVAAGTNATGNNAPVQPGLPAGVVSGDLLLIHVSIRNSGVGVPIQPSGWFTLMQVVAAARNVAVFGRFYVPGDVMPTIAFSAGVANADTLAQSAAFRGVSREVAAQLTALATQLNGASLNVDYPALSLGGKDRHLVLLSGWMQDDFTAVSANPAGSTLIGTIATSTAGDDAGQFWRYIIQTTAADITAGTVTITGGTSVISRTMIGALKPAASIATVLQDSWPPRVQIVVTDLTLGDAVSIYRSVSGVRTLVLGATSTAVTDPSFLRIDASVPFGVPVTYVAVVNGVEYTSGPVTYTLPGGKVALSDAVTALAAEVVIHAWPSKRRERQATTFRPGGRNVVVSGALSRPTGEIELYTDAYSSVLNLIALLDGATQGIIQIRQPGGYNGVDGFFAVIGYEEKRFSQDGTDNRRWHVLQVVEVDGWAAAFTALGYTYADQTTKYTGLTYANLAADFATYLLMSQGDFT